MSSLRDRCRRTKWPGTLRPYQSMALDAVTAAWGAERDRIWVVLPPGAGKTLVGLEAARRLGRKTVILVPNTAIQAQWLAHWEGFEPATVRAGTDRGLRAAITVLTYQSLAVFDPERETDLDGRRVQGTLGRLHDNGLALISSLRAAGPLTLVLDECHHLLDVWGRLLAEVLEGLPGTRVIGLTATPPESLRPAEARLVSALFGSPILGASIPALVREGHLAPFAELAWITTPTAVETAYIAGEAERFAELTTDLIAPGFASVDFLPWLDRKFVIRDGVSWADVERAEPELAAAALRFCHAGLLTLPPGARPREEHRHRPAAEDWVILLGDYARRCLLPSATALEATALDAAAPEAALEAAASPEAAASEAAASEAAASEAAASEAAARDAAALAAIRRALPAVGYSLTRAGIRAAQSPVDRVLARSAAKTRGAVEIAAAEAASLGDRLRCAVLCDHERAGGRPSARLRDVLDPEAGSAWLLLRDLLADPRTAPLAPMLVTGRTVACGPAGARDFTARHPGLTWAEEDGVAVIKGSSPAYWSPRTWVPLVTAYFEEGGCRVLVGTRALLGEGWDARGVNTLIDLTTATTTTSVVQTRGRALRLDPAWPEKTSNTWTVVAVTDRHPKGAGDWARFVRKHQGYPAAGPGGSIITGVSHVDPAFSPYAPPSVAELDAVNVRMLARAADRSAARAGWRIGSPFRDEFVHTLRMRPARGGPVVSGSVAAGAVPRAVPAPDGIAPAPRGSFPSRREMAWGTGVLAGLWLLTIALVWVSAIAAIVSGVAAIRAWGALRYLGRALPAVREAAGEPSPLRFGYAVADTLAATGLSRHGAERVRARVEQDGTWSIALEDVDAATSERFTLALDEVVSPMAAPRYVVPRYVLPSGRIRARPVPEGVVYHSVPSVFGQNRTRAAEFARAWNRWISAGDPVRTATPQGEGVLATHRGEDPFAVTTMLRVTWS